MISMISLINITDKYYREILQSLIPQSFQVMTQFKVLSEIQACYCKNFKQRDCLKCYFIYYKPSSSLLSHTPQKIPFL